MWTSIDRKQMIVDIMESEDIGKLIKIIRCQDGMTQEDLAKKIGTTKSVISRFEQHYSDMKISTFVKIMTCLGKKIKITIT